MRQTNTHALKVQTRLCILLILCALSATQNYEEGDSCDFSGYSGTCLETRKCVNLPASAQALGLKPHQIGRCGFLVNDEIICCPLAVVQRPPNIFEPLKPFEFRPPRVESTTVEDNREKNLNAILEAIFSKNVNETRTISANELFLQFFNKKKFHSNTRMSQSTIDTNRLGNATANVKACETRHYKGVCLTKLQCAHLAQTLADIHLNETDVTPCDREDIICCPNIERPAVRACQVIEHTLMPSQGALIYGGYRVSAMQYPHMAYIMYDIVNVVCGGTLIHKRFVLTAAHCVIVRNANPKNVIMGISDFNDPDQTPYRQEIGIEAAFVHTKYSSFTKYFDIAVIKLAKDVKFSPTVYPTCLHTEETELPDGIELTAAGWGRSENESISKHLLAVNLNKIPHAECNHKYANQLDRTLNHGIEATQLCALAPGKDTCLGDSGGPLLLVKNETYNSYRIVGVVSFGSVICGRTLPGVYTRVSKFLDFIEAIVWPEPLRNR